MSTVARTLKHGYLHPLRHATWCQSQQRPFSLASASSAHLHHFAICPQIPVCRLAQLISAMARLSVPSTRNLSRSRRWEDRGRKRAGTKCRVGSGLVVFHGARRAVNTDAGREWVQGWVCVVVNVSVRSGAVLRSFVPLCDVFSATRDGRRCWWRLDTEVINA